MVHPNQHGLKLKSLLKCHGGVILSVKAVSLFQSANPYTVFMRLWLNSTKRVYQP